MTTFCVSLRRFPCPTTTARGRSRGFARARMLVPTQAHRRLERGDGEGEGRGVCTAKSGGVGTEGAVGWIWKCHVFVLRTRIVPAELVRGRLCST